jgi:hypothetical protein
MIRGRWTRTLTLTVAMALPFASGVLMPSRAFAQEPADAAADPNGESGRPLDGYLLTLCFAGAALFVIGKSARR